MLDPWSRQPAARRVHDRSADAGLWRRRIRCRGQGPITRRWSTANGLRKRITKQLGPAHSIALDPGSGRIHVLVGNVLYTKDPNSSWVSAPLPAGVDLPVMRLDPATGTLLLVPPCSIARRPSTSSATGRSRSSGGSSARPTTPCSSRVTRTCPDPSRRPGRSRPSTSRPSASGRSTTSRTARWPGARSRPGSSRRRSAGTSSRRRSCATARSARACSRPTSRSTTRSTSWRWSSRTTRGCAGWRSFDAAVNNTDRKGGHILPVDGGRHIHGVDHGVCFSPVPEAADRAVGLARRAVRRGRDGRAGAASASRRSMASSPTLARAAEPGRGRATTRRVDALLDGGPLPLSPRRPGRRSPGRRSERSGPAAQRPVGVVGRRRRTISRRTRSRSR